MIPYLLKVSDTPIIKGGRIMLKGCFTAIITPFKDNGVDYEGLEQLVDFQMANGVSGILAVGTTGESPVLSWGEHNHVVENIAKKTRQKCVCIAGAGSNNTSEALAASDHAVKAGADAILLVDPYYNGPSSIEIRKEYVAPVAKANPETRIIPYVIPGRTGAQLLPEDLALLFNDFKNVDTVKEATGNVENMKRTRTCCGKEFTILSGDDGLTFPMMTDTDIEAAGVISVLSNIVPGPVCQMVQNINQGNLDKAKKLADALDPLFGLVTVKTMENTPYGEVVCRARNPLGIKSLMNVLGVPSGICRQPLGKMSRSGLTKVVDTAKNSHADHPELLMPLAEFFNVDIDERLNDPKYQEGLYYSDY